MKLFGWRAVLSQTQTDTKFSLILVCLRVTACVYVSVYCKSVCGFAAYVTTLSRSVCVPLVCFSVLLCTCVASVF